MAIGQVRVDLVANAGQFISDIKRASRQYERELKEMKRQAKQLAKATAVAAAGAATGLAVLTKRAIDSADEMGKLNKRLGISTAALSEYRLVAEKGNIAFRQLTLGLQRMIRRVAEAAEGTGEAKKAIEEMGLSAQHLKSLAPEQQFEVIAEALSQVESASDRVRLAMKFFDSEGVAILQTFGTEGAEAIRAVREEARQFGLTVDTETAAAAEQFNDNLTLLRMGVSGMGNELASNLLPSLVELTNQLIGASSQGQAFKDAADGIAGVIRTVAAGFFTVAAAVRATVNATAPVIEQWKLLFELAKGPLGDPAAAWNRYQRALATASDGIDKEIEALSAKFQALFAPPEAGGANDPAKAAEAYAAELQAVLDGIRASADSERRAAADKKTLLDAQKKLNTAGEQFREWLGRTRAELAGPLAVAEREHAKQLDEFRDLYHQGAITLAEFAQAQELLDETLKDAADPLADYRERIQGLIDDIEGFNVDPMKAAMTQLEAALETFADDPAMVAAIESAIESLGDEMGGLNEEAMRFGDILQRNAALSVHGLRSLQSMAREGSDAYQALEVAIQAANVVAAVGAVLNQGSGDPYTAFARMAAMAAAVASLGYSVGSLGGAFADVAGDRQAIQGTGTVLGDPTAKSDSILQAVEITASATEELVGINKGMLRALQSLEGGIEGAATFLARGNRGAQFGEFSAPDLFDNILFTLFDPLGIIGSILGGSSDVVDQGIALLGGTISDTISRGLIQAFQQTDYRTWLFGSTRTRDDFANLDQGTVDQFNLILTSLTDAVRAGAEALGLSAGEIDRAINEFRIAEQRISLMGLSPEEQERELLAVFSAIFDDLAASVVPFIDQFQQAGEGLGETLIRVATEVQVAQEAIDQLGLIVGDLDPEQFAQLADGLIQAAGGIESFINGMQAFVRHFAPDARQFEIAQSELTRAFAEAGLQIPETRDAMWDLMQTLDATTEEGRQQIATLLGLADTADAYYSALERVQQEQEGLERQLLSALGDTEALRAMELATLHESNRELQLRIWALEDERDRVEALISLNEMMRNLFLETVDSTGYLRRFDDISRAEQQAIRDANELAIAAGRAGASERELALIERWAVSQRNAAIRDLRRSIQDLMADLFGTPLEGIESQIAALEDQQSRARSALDQVGAELRRTFEAWKSGLRDIQSFLDAMLLGPLTPLTPAEQLAEAQRQFRELLGRAQSGDAEALAGLPGAAQSLLEIGRGFWSSGDAYQALFDSVRDALESVGMARGPAGAGAGGGAVAQMTEELRGLYEERDRLLAEQHAADQAWQGMELAQHLALLAHRTGIPIAELADDLGLDLGQLAEALGTDMTGLNLLLVKLESQAAKEQAVLASLEQSNRDAVDQLQMIEANTAAWLQTIENWQPVVITPRGVGSHDGGPADPEPPPIPDLPPDGSGGGARPPRGGPRRPHDGNEDLLHRLDRIETAILAGNTDVAAELRRSIDVMEKRRGLG